MLQTKRDSTKSLFHSGAISLGEAKFHSPKANFTEKSQVEFRLGFFLGRGRRIHEPTSADGARKKNTARCSSRGSRHYVPFRTRFLIAPTHTKQKKPNALWRGLLLFGRGRRIRTRDPRFWSGSELWKSLANPRVFARFNAFSSQDRVSQLCLNIFDALLMLYQV